MTVVITNTSMLLQLIYEIFELLPKCIKVFLKCNYTKVSKRIETATRNESISLYEQKLNTDQNEQVYDAKTYCLSTNFQSYHSLTPSAIRSS